jgi:hypothetical protein
MVVGCQQISVMEPRIEEMRNSMPKAIAIPSHDWGVEGLFDHASKFIQSSCSIAINHFPFYLAVKCETQTLA